MILNISEITYYLIYCHISLKISICVFLASGNHSPIGSINGGTMSPNLLVNTSASQQLPPACGARQLSKLKRFLTTLQQFGSDISPEIGERVRTLVLGLVVCSIHCISKTGLNCSSLLILYEVKYAVRENGHINALVNSLSFRDMWA